MLKFRLIHLLPIILISIFAWSFTLLFTSSNIKLSQPLLAPLQDLPKSTSPSIAFTNITPYLNSFIFIIIICITGYCLFYLLSRFKSNIRYFTIIILWLSSFMLTSFSIVLLSLNLVNYIGPDYLITIVNYRYVIGAIFGSFIVLPLFRERELSSLLSSSYLGSGLGVLMGASLPFWTTIILLISISIFDIYAVKFGYLKNLNKLNISQLRGFIIQFRGLGLGLGDVFFYSLIIYFAFSNFGFISGISATFGLIIGFIFTLLILNKHHLVPALPSSLFCGLFFILISILL